MSYSALEDFMGISYKLDNFEGPLDLLLHLIDKNKVNIYDIPIATITEQYLDYVNHMETEDLNIVSEFLVMAATLIDIKARMLLPREINEEGEEEDPRAELVARLLEYKYYKYMSLELKDREVGADRLLYKSPSIPSEVAKYEPPVDLDKLLDGLTLAKLQEIFRAVTKRVSDRVDPIRSRFGNIRRESISLEDKIKSVMDYAREHRKFSFRGLLERQQDRTLVVVTFLALLELMKIGKITLSQEHLFDDMIIETLEPEGEDGELDLSELQEEPPSSDTFMPGKQSRKEEIDG
jgi:segregation and condensation protein A